MAAGALGDDVFLDFLFAQASSGQSLERGKRQSVANRECEIGLGPHDASEHRLAAKLARHLLDNRNSHRSLPEGPGNMP